MSLLKRVERAQQQAAAPAVGAPPLVPPSAAPPASLNKVRVAAREEMLRDIKQRFPQIWLHCFSASEILAIAEYSGLNVRDTIIRLRDTGLDSIPGGGAEILDDDVRLFRYGV